MFLKRICQHKKVSSIKVPYEKVAWQVYEFLKMLGLYLGTLIIDHKHCSMLFIQIELILQQNRTIS